MIRDKEIERAMAIDRENMSDYIDDRPRKRFKRKKVVITIEDQEVI